MKKIFYFIASAIVALGAVACQNEVDENITPNTQSEGLSFTATINQETKVAWDGLTPSWKDGDIVTIDGFEFVYDDDGKKFTCTHENVMDLVDGENKTATHGTFNSNNGVEGTVFTAEGKILAEGTILEFSPANALLKFVAPKDNTILTGEGLFSTGGTFTVTPSAEVQYVAINATTATFSYSVNSTEVKKIENKEFVAGKIYDLGTLSAYTVYVTAQPKSGAAAWKTINLYAWNDKGNNASWPGIDITANTKVINGYTYHYYTFPASFNNTDVNVIVNNGTQQTPDIVLGTLNKDYYVVYSNNTMFEKYETAPEAGSIKEYVAPTEPQMLYLNAQNWGYGDARFAAYFFGNGEEWVDMTKVKDTTATYEVEIPEGFTKVIFVRMNGTTQENKWENKWNQTGNLDITGNVGKTFTITQWDEQTSGWGE